MSDKSALKSYPAGHHESVLRSHMSRSAQNSAQHLIPHLKSGMKVLDIGCGPGTISTSLANIVGPLGSVIGLDPSAEVIEQARMNSITNREHKNVTFEVGDAVHLRFEDSSFDVVHAHQVLQHVSEPVAMLREMRRVAKSPGGIISLREGDLPSSLLYPDPGGMYSIFLDTYTRTASASGADPRLGRKLHIYLDKAGFKSREVSIQMSAMSYGAGKPEEAEWWANSWADRCLKSGFHDDAIKGGHATEETLQKLSKMWREWAECEGALWAIFQAEAICTIYA